MAAYAATVSVDLPRTERLDRELAIITGTCDITNYNQTGAEITDITKYFTSVVRVICDGVSDNGYLVKWDATDKCFHAYYPTHIAATTGTVNDALGFATGSNAFVTANADHTANSEGAEVADDTDVGEVNFIAIGYWH